MRLRVCRTAARTVHDSRGLSVALRRTVLSLQDVPDGNDVIGIDPDHNGVHNRALSGHLSLAARTGDFRSVAGSARGGRRLGGRLSNCHSVPDTHAHLLLHAASTDRTPACRLSHLYDSRPVDAKHEIRVSGTNTINLSSLWRAVHACSRSRSRQPPLARKSRSNV